MGCPPNACKAGVDPGSLNRFVTVQEQITVPDGCGGSTVSWGDKGGLWCSVKISSGRENKADDRVRAAAAFKFKMGWVDAESLTLTESDRLILDGVQYNIRVIDNSTWFRVAYEVTAERGVTQ